MIFKDEIRDDSKDVGIFSLDNGLSSVDDDSYLV